MIPLTRLAEALAALLQQRTGIPVFPREIDTAVYPMYSLTLTPLESTLTAGGTQVFRQVEAAVCCCAQRRREAASTGALIDRLLEALLPGLPLCDRHFTPKGLRRGTREGLSCISFVLEFCDLAAAPVETGPAVPMQQLHLALDTRPYL